VLEAEAVCKLTVAKFTTGAAPDDCITDHVTLATVHVLPTGQFAASRPAPPICITLDDGSDMFAAYAAVTRNMAPPRIRDRTIACVLFIG